MSYRIEHTNPTAAQWMSLRQSVGWATFAQDAAEQSLAATPFCVCAFDGEELVGMGRVLGDGVISFYIGNIMVRPDKQREGLGKEIMQHVMDYVSAHAAPGAIASLLSIKGKENFYTQFGFEARPDDTHGCGMSIHY